MSIEGQGHFFTIYFLGFVCFVLYLAKISGERLQDHWSSGISVFTIKLVGIQKFKNFTNNVSICFVLLCLRFQASCWLLAPRL